MLDSSLGRLPCRIFLQHQLFVTNLYKAHFGVREFCLRHFDLRRRKRVGSYCQECLLPEELGC